MKDLSMILARDKNNVIGRGNSLPWKSKKDMKFFVDMTRGRTVVMGRNTWDSLPVKPLPNRRNIVISSRGPVEGDAETVTLDQFLTDFKDVPNLICIGGKALYEELLPHCHTVYITQISAECPGDVKYEEEFRDFEEYVSYVETDDSFEDEENGIREVSMKMFMLCRPSYIYRSNVRLA